MKTVSWWKSDYQLSHERDELRRDKYNLNDEDQRYLRKIENEITRREEERDKEIRAEKLVQRRAEEKRQEEQYEHDYYEEQRYQEYLRSQEAE